MQRHLAFCASVSAGMLLTHAATAHPASTTRDPELSHVHISGRVTTSDGRPIAGARLMWGTPAQTYRSGSEAGAPVPPRTSPGVSVPESRSLFNGVPETCFQRAPSMGYVRTRADGSYDLIFTFKRECDRYLDGLGAESVRVYVEKEDYVFERARSASGPPIRMDGPIAPLPSRDHAPAW